MKRRFVVVIGSFFFATFIGVQFLTSGIFSAMINNASRTYCKIDESFPSRVVVFTKDEVEVEQNFEVTSDMLKHKKFTTEIQFGTYQRTNHVILNVTLQQDGFSKSQEISAGILADNKYHPIEWDTSELKAGRAQIKIYCTGTGENNFIGVYTTKDLVFHTDMMINQEKKEENLKMKIVYRLR